MRNFTCPSCRAEFPEDQCHSRPFAPLDCGVIVQCPRCDNEFEPPVRLPYASVWPKLNKQEDISAYMEQVQRMEFDQCRAQVEETVCLTCDEWDHFRTHLLESHSWLAGKGGCPSRGVRSVLLVVMPGETAAESVGIFVDPQGYDYARYVGFYMTSTKPRTVTNPPDLPTLKQAMDTKLCGRTYAERVLRNILFDRQAEAVGA